MLIGELAARTGLSRDTIRFYEKQGLIAVGKKERRFNSYKEYSEQTFQRLVQIKRIKGLGFTLNETQEMLDMIDQQKASCEAISQKVTDKVGLINQKIKELEELKQVLTQGITQCETRCRPLSESENCPILVSDLLKIY